MGPSGYSCSGGRRPIAYANCDCNTHSDTYSYHDTLTYSHAQGDTSASAHPAPAADAVLANPSSQGRRIGESGKANRQNRSPYRRFLFLAIDPCAETKLELRENMRATRVLVLILIVQTCCIAMAQAQSPNMIGSWNIEITFGNGDKRSLRLDAQDAGKGTLLVVDPRLKVWGPGKPSEAKWTQGEENSVTFAGLVEFMLGNVGRDAGTLVFKGKFDTPNLITGEVEFSPLVGDRPSKHGTFKATRAGG
jgi:hypothetical protein